jgi:tetratricopeptide (TPR) repeat protein
MQGDYTAARPLLEASVAILRPVGDQRHQPLGALAAIALLQGDYRQAVVYFEERLANHRRQGSKVYNVRDLSDVGIATTHLGDFAQAATLFHEALLLAQELNSPSIYDVAVCLLGVAGIQRSLHRMAQLLAAAQATFERSSEVVEPLYRMELERTENKICEVLDEQDFAKFSAEGRAMTVEQAIAFALEAREN